MSETGVLHYFEKKFRQPDECAVKKSETQRTNARSLSIIEVAAMFIVLAVGVGTSTLVLLLEVTWIRINLTFWEYYGTIFHPERNNHKRSNVSLLSVQRPTRALPSQ